MLTGGVVVSQRSQLAPHLLLLHPTGIVKKAVLRSRRLTGV